MTFGQNIRSALGSRYIIENPHLIVPQTLLPLPLELVLLLLLLILLLLFSLLPALERLDSDPQTGLILAQLLHALFDVRSQILHSFALQST